MRFLRSCRLNVFVILMFLMPFQSHVWAKNLYNTFSLAGSSNRYSWTSTQNESSLNLDLSTTYEYSSQFSFGHGISTYKDLKTSQTWELDDGYFYGSYRVEEDWKMVGISLLSRIYYPSSEVSRNEKSMQTKLFFAPVFGFTFPDSDFDFLSVTLRPGYTHGFYKYKTSTAGASNVRSSFSQLMALGLSFNSWSQFISTFNYVWSWDHSGNKRPDQFTWAQDIVFKLNSMLDLTIGYQNQGQSLGHLAMSGEFPHLTIKQVFFR